MLGGNYRNGKGSIRVILASTDTLYLTISVDNADQALSLAEYLSRHGICAAQEGNDAVVCILTDPEAAVMIHQLRAGWRRYWEHSDSGLFGAPMRADALPML